MNDLTPPTPSPQSREGEQWGELSNPLSTLWRGGRGVRSLTNSITAANIISANHAHGAERRHTENMTVTIIHIVVEVCLDGIPRAALA